ncbi:MAG: LCP family protein [Propionibacteriaceae bacterium]|jgi:LCP family protein required for cell wall assembly|nr:LCP family protein [Propionibacteriaceae bacterium]
MAKRGYEADEQPTGYDPEGYKHDATDAPVAAPDSPPPPFLATEDAALDSHTEPSIETPVEQLIEPPVETPVETQDETPVDLPTEPPIETPVETEVEPPVELPTELPAKPSTSTGIRVLDVAGKVLSVVMAAAIAYAAYRVSDFGALPHNWLIAGVIGAAVVVCGLVTGLWLLKARRHPVLYGVLTTVTALVSAVAIYGAVAAGNVSNAISGMQPPTSDYLQYDVLVLNEHPDGVESLAGETVGYLKTDQYAPDARELLDAEVSTNYRGLDSLTDVASALRTKTIDATLIEDSLYRSFQDADAELFKQLKVLKVLRVRIDINSDHTNGDILQPFIVYISGIDQYGTLNPRGLSDVNMLVVVNPITNHILMVNTPRDYYVQLHDTQGYPDKLTHAGTYGVDMSIETLQDLYGIDINFWVRVNFDSVIRLVDALGGVDVESTESFTCVHGGYYVQQGMNHMNGEQALCFARERYHVEGGDHGRGRNQQRLLTGIIDKVIDPSILVNYSSMLSAMNERVQMSFTMDDLATLVRNQLTNGKGWQIETTAVGGAGSSQPTYTYGSELLYVMLPNQEQVSTAAAQMKAVLDER